MAVLVLAAGLWLESSVEKQLVKGLEEDLTTILEGNVSALEQWMQSQERIASLSSAEPEARDTALSLIESSRNGKTTPEQLFEDPRQQTLREVVGPTMQHWEFKEFLLVADDVIVAAQDQAAIGRILRADSREALERLQVEDSVLSRPQIREAWNDERRLSMWVVSPIRDAAQKIKGALAFRIDPRESFTKILRTSEYGRTGETYAFDAKGLMLSESRFDEQLERAGILEKNQESFLTVEVRDPRVDLTQAHAQTLDKKGPLTLPVRQARAGRNGVDAKGYRDYRGVEVVGAWHWLDEYGFGVVTEIDKGEAYASVAVIRNVTRALFLVLVFAAILIVIASAMISRLSKKAERAERLGNYTLESKLGEGGMGAVYRARHALLRRPTAIKVIRPENLDEGTRERFEREVQATARLCHPNTIAVFDYGRTPDGIFYYAMEFLEGVDLHKLVQEAGPIVERRVLHILAQVLGSLAEAHEQGMVHRDIKPANIMLCRRGGVADSVKVLDFGLVKDLEANDGFTKENSLTGTPQYMAPEAVTATSEVDQRTDLYAVSAVGYFLLTGRQLFSGRSVMSILTQQIAHPPARPSQSTTNPVSDAFEVLLLRGLEKEQSKRPTTARVFLREIERIQALCESWTQVEAHQWWDRHDAAATANIGVQLSGSPTLEIDLEGRETPPS